MLQSAVGGRAVVRSISSESLSRTRSGVKVTHSHCGREYSTGVISASSSVSAGCFSCRLRQLLNGFGALGLLMMKWALQTRAGKSSVNRWGGVGVRRGSLSFDLVGVGSVCYSCSIMGSLSATGDVLSGGWTTYLGSSNALCGLGGASRDFVATTSELGHRVPRFERSSGGIHVLDISVIRPLRRLLDCIEGSSNTGSSLLRCSRNGGWLESE
ncbi:unnamed protein product [Boreogadus saida]